MKGRVLARVLLVAPGVAHDCPYCTKKNPKSEFRPKVVRNGNFRRKSDGRVVQRLLCKECGKGFSYATFDACYRQNKRHKNDPLRKLLCSGVSQRRAALILKISRTTVVRKFLFLAAQAQKKTEDLLKSKPPATEIEFDDMETFEHTKCKPLSITLAVVSQERRILGFEVSRMPAKSALAKIALKKYGPRPDERPQGRARLFERIKPFIRADALIKSDQNPHYPRDVMRFFPHCTHKTYKGRRGCVVGQGELKRGGFDPLFSLNHTCAKIRADINRLFRRTWCTTKKAERLAAHLALYVQYHNESLKKKTA